MVINSHMLIAFFSLTLTIVPHIGHLHSAVLADTFKRFHEMKGRKAILSTGTDEHGLKVSSLPWLALFTSPICFQTDTKIVYA